MHTQHVKFSAYVAWGRGVGRAVAVVLVFEEGEVSGLVEDDDRSVFEVVVLVVSFLPSPSFFLLVLGFIDTIWPFLLVLFGGSWGFVVITSLSLALFLLFDQYR